MKASMAKKVSLVLVAVFFGLIIYMLASIKVPESCTSFICAVSYNILPLLGLAFVLMLLIATFGVS